MCILKLRFEYKCYPVWIYCNETLLENDLPEDIKSNSIIREQLQILQDEYNSLFIDDGVEFRYLGFEEPERRASFLGKVQDVYALLSSICSHYFRVENCVDID